MLLLSGVRGSNSVTFQSLLQEMGDRSSLARWPEPVYQTLQASSYNRESTRRDKPGWFADSDGTGYIRTEGEGANKEWVMMEHNGPGCITKIWTPFFYYDFNDRFGPNVRIYLDGQTKPVIDESLIRLVCGKGSISNPWAAYSARAGNLYLPIPFAKSAKVTMKGKSFYFNINYRAYPAGTTVETFSPSLMARKLAVLDLIARKLVSREVFHETSTRMFKLEPGAEQEVFLPKGAHVVDQISIDIPEAKSKPSILRTTVLAASFDRIGTIWCPVGDFFCSADSLHPFETMTRSVSKGGEMNSRWIMPYRSTGHILLGNYGRETITIGLKIKTRSWKWDSRSMHFYARWRPDDIVPGSPFTDWNLVDIFGKGVYVGDAWTVLNIRKDSWWGEGDEKVYVDDAWDHGFPTHFGTGSEDYYGWAGGVYPVLEDQFSSPFLANVKVGGLDGHTLGYNILTRTRGLDAIPFQKRLRFDMESSFGTDMREKWNLLGYSVVTFWYAFPGAKHNRPDALESCLRPIMSIPQLQEMSDAIRDEGK